MALELIIVSCNTCFSTMVPLRSPRFEHFWGLGLWDALGFARRNTEQLTGSIGNAGQPPPPTSSNTVHVDRAMQAHGKSCHLFNICFPVQVMFLLLFCCQN